jgi:predicted transposase YbfD/YdcC
MKKARRQEPFKRKLGRFMLKHLVRALSNSGVIDPRNNKNRKWTLEQILLLIMMGLVSGKLGFKEAEEMTGLLSGAVRRAFGITGNISDGAMWDLCQRLGWEEIRNIIVESAKAAHRRHSLDTIAEHVPVPMVALDGKYYGKTWIRIQGDGDESWKKDYPFLQEKKRDGNRVIGEVRLVSVLLVRGSAPVFLDAVPVRGVTNEMGTFKEVFARLMDQWGDKQLFRLVTMDAGMVSRENADIVDTAEMGYLMAVKGNQPDMLAEMKRQLDGRSRAEVDHFSSERYQGNTVEYRLWRTKDIAGWNGWTHIKQGFREERRVISADPDKPDEVGTRYFITNRLFSHLKSKDWLQVIRNHWQVENNGHCTLDVSLQEDKRPWSRHPHVYLIIALLRRVAFNLLSLYRGVCQRSEKNRRMPWRRLLAQVYAVWISAAEEDFLDRRELKRRNIAA